MATVFLTDHPWADLDVERGVFDAAGFQLVAGPAKAAPTEEIERMVQEVKPAAIVTCWAPVSASTIRSAPGLRIISRMGVGLDNIDIAVATEVGAVVTNVPDYCVHEVADHAVSMALALERGVVMLDRDVKARGWHIPAFVPRRFSSLTVGIIGYGRIGKAAAAKFRALGFRVLVCSRSFIQAEGGVEPVSLEELRRQSDIIVLNIPLVADTTHLINAEFIADCRLAPVIVNVSRGALVDNDALIDGLERGLLRGAALDVVEGEPDPPHALIMRPDVVVTPHVAYLSRESLRELRQRACEAVVRVLKGDRPLNACNTLPDCGERLPGGVSSDVQLVDSADGPLVIKQLLPQLKVSAEWQSDPRRAHTEVRALAVAARLLGQSAVPEVLWTDLPNNRFAMRRVDPRLGNWKEQLLSGRVDASTAAQAGRLLGLLHRRSAEDPAIAEQFADETYFRELRLEPFFDQVADGRPDLAAAIHSVVSAMRGRKGALVHGDYSPKNILADGADVVILDFEVAHWGDPAFDLAFLLCHLLLKGSMANADARAYAIGITAFLDGYREEAAADIDQAHLTRIVGCLMLARVEGKSPVDYISQLNVPQIIDRAVAMIVNPTPSILMELKTMKVQA